MAGKTAKAEETKPEVVEEPVVRNKIEFAGITKFLDPPKGRKARQMMPAVLNFMKELADIQQDAEAAGDDMGLATRFMNYLWANPEFEDKILPFALQMETPEERAFLDAEGTPLEIVEAFMKAAQYLVEESFQRPEVEEALKKSDGGEPSTVAEQVPLQSTAPPA